MLYVDFPLAIANSDSLSNEELSNCYSNTLTNALGGQNSKLLFKEDTKLSGKQAMRYKGSTVESGADIFIHAGLLLVKNRMYLLQFVTCLLYTSPSPRDQRGSRMPSSA